MPKGVKFAGNWHAFFEAIWHHSPIRRAAGQSLPENPNRSTHSWESKRAPNYRAFRKMLFGGTFRFV